MKLIYKLLLKFGLLGLLLVGLNWVYATWFLEADLQEHSPVINKIRKVPKDVDILYVGESSNRATHPSDKSQGKISRYVELYFPELKTTDITKNASHAGIYYTLLNALPADNEVKTVIVTLNLRSFNAQWMYSKLETSLQKEMVLLGDYPPLLNRMLLSFKGYDAKSKSERALQVEEKWRADTFKMLGDFQFQHVMEWDKWVSNTGLKDSTGEYNRELTGLGCHYVKAYGFQLDTANHPRIEEFNRIVALAQQRCWNLVFTLMAENMNKAQKLVGSDLTEMMYTNARLLEDYYEKKGVIVVNNLDVIEDKQFIDQHWTTEHYYEKGRKIIATNIVEEIKHLHVEDYLDVKLLEAPHLQD